MDGYEAIRTRKSVRAWSERPVEEDRLERVLSAARLAPSATNRQEWRFVVVSDPGLRRLLGIDVAIAMDHLTLAAAAEGLGTCWVVQLMPLGYPRDSSPVAKQRLVLSAIVHRERW